MANEIKVTEEKIILNYSKSFMDRVRKNVNTKHFFIVLFLCDDYKSLKNGDVVVYFCNKENMWYYVDNVIINEV